MAQSSREQVAQRGLRKRNGDVSLPEPSSSKRAKVTTMSTFAVADISSTTIQEAYEAVEEVVQQRPDNQSHLVMPRPSPTQNGIVVSGNGTVVNTADGNEDHHENKGNQKSEDGDNEAADDENDSRNDEDSDEDLDVAQLPPHLRWPVASRGTVDVRFDNEVHEIAQMVDLLTRRFEEPGRSDQCDRNEPWIPAAANELLQKATKAVHDLPLSLHVHSSWVSKTNAIVAVVEIFKQFHKYEAFRDAADLQARGNFLSSIVEALESIINLTKASLSQKKTD